MGMSEIILKTAWKNIWRSQGMDPAKCTCVNCASNKDCEVAFDMYNEDGDCLMEK